MSGLFLRLSVSPYERDLQTKQFVFTDVTTTKASCGGCETRYKYVIKMRHRPVLKVLSNCGLRHQAQDQAEEILKLQSIPGWSENR